MWLILILFDIITKGLIQIFESVPFVCHLNF